MKKILAIVKTRPYHSVAVAALLLVAIFALGTRGESTEEVLTVAPGPFVQEVSVSGKVVAAEEVDLTFPETGRVASVSAAVGQRVGAGRVLATLSMGTLLSDLESAKAQVALRRAATQSTQTNVEQITREQDELVSSAYRTMLSEGLTAVPDSSNTSRPTPPIVSGIYDGAEGTYRVRVLTNVSQGKYDLRVFNLESSERVEILEDEPTPLGTRGLFITFPDDLSTYGDTTWDITIPNKKSSSYLSNYNAYQEAIRTRDRAIASAKADLEEGSQGSSVAKAQLQQAEAEEARIRAMIAERTLRAPFAGVITFVDAKVGAVVSGNTRAISMISNGSLQIESYVPEINVALLQVGDGAKITLDAYGEAVVFAAKVVSIDPAETVRDGVSTYRIILQFDINDERLKSGMTANVTIVTDERENIISVPQGIVTERGGKKYVQVKNGTKVEEREVTTGIVSSLGNIEIVRGLTSGETVVLVK